MKPTIDIIWCADSKVYVATRSDYPSITAEGENPLEAAFELGAVLSPIELEDMSYAMTRKAAGLLFEKSRPAFTFPEVELTKEEKREIEEEQ